MGLLNRIGQFFGRKTPSAPPALRNKPGGLAWIRGISELDGRVVTTVRISQADCWLIDPPQIYISQINRVGINGVKAKPGDQVTTIGIADTCLEPIRNVGDDERDESADWLPSVPKQAQPA